MSALNDTMLYAKITIGRSISGVHLMVKNVRT